jgi:hypothetical protein
MHLVATGAVLAGVAGLGSAVLLNFQTAMAYTRFDPIVSPSVVSSHVHVFAGANVPATTMSFNGLRQSSCTNAEVQEDRSAVWVPAVYQLLSNGSLKAAPLVEWRMYWMNVSCPNPVYARIVWLFDR